MSELFIDDGYTLTKSLEAAPGLHPAVEVVYRPALSKERHAYATVLGTKDATRIDAFESDLIARHVQALNGSPVPKDRAAKLRPTLQAKLVDLVLSYSPADEAAAGKG